MDIGKTPISIPSFVKINQELETLAIKASKKLLREMLLDISRRYNISQHELMQRYMT